MDKNDGGLDGIKSNASLWMQTTEDFAKAFLATTPAATTVQSTPSTPVVSSSSAREENNSSPLQKLKRQVTMMFKGFSSPPEVTGPYNPEVLTSHKRQWTRFQKSSWDNKCSKEPSRIFESMVIVGLHPKADVQQLENIALGRNHEETKARNIFNSHNQVHALSTLEPQVLFAYPPEKPLPLKYKDLLSFCLPGGVQVHAVERTPSCSELNEILLGQEQLMESNQSFVFRLQVAEDSTLYGCCIIVEELVQRPSKLVSMLLGENASFSSLSRNVITTPRCYCILSRLPFFDLHFGVLQSILIEERFERLVDGVDILNLLSSEEAHDDDDDDDVFHGTDSKAEERYLDDDDAIDLRKTSESSGEVSPKGVSDCINSPENSGNQLELNSEVVQNISYSETNKEADDFVSGMVAEASAQEGSNIPIDEDQGQKQSEVLFHENEVTEPHNDAVAQENCGNFVEDLADRQSEIPFNDAVLPFLRCRLNESSESPTSSQDSPSGDRNSRSGIHEMDLEEPSSIGHGDLVGHDNILQWAKARNYGSLQVICEYYQLQCPSRGSSLKFHPLEHLHPLKFDRPSEIVLQIAGSTIDVRSFNASLEVAEVHNTLLAEEEATALSVWAVACICGCLRLENVMSLFAAALLEKQIVVVCSNLGMLSASVLSVIPLIRPYHWQSLLIPILPDGMLDFLDAPVPYIIGVQNKTADTQSRLANVVVVDANKNQVRSASVPQLPQQKELLALLRPYHSTLVGESYLARKRPVYECTDAQVEAAKGFLAVLRSYIDSLCSNLRSHTITNVQSNNDKVSLLLRESFIGSFPSRDRPFMKHFVDTQLFSVHSDLVISVYQKD